jgi:hypothetical protein
MAFSIESSAASGIPQRVLLPRVRRSAAQRSLLQKGKYIRVMADHFPFPILVTKKICRAPLCEPWYRRGVGP